MIETGIVPVEIYGLRQQRRIFMKKAKKLLLFLLFVLILGNIGTAAAGDTDWYWISSDTKYGKFFAPDRVRVMSSVQGVPVQIEAWTKTVYTYAGAAETIANYGLGSTITNPAALSYSLARVEINPQNRQLTYMEEIFYDAQGNVVWTKTDPKHTPKEINSRSFDQDFYCMIVDQVFKQDEFNKMGAADRWLTLWQARSADGSTVNCWTDTMTIRLRGENAIAWIWEETKDAAGNTTEIKFRKKAFNLPNATGKIIRYNYWSAATGWTEKDSELDGRYYSLIPDSNEDVGAKVLKKYVETHKDWVTRYTIKENEQDPAGDTGANDAVKNIIKNAGTTQTGAVTPAAPTAKK